MKDIFRKIGFLLFLTVLLFISSSVLAIEDFYVDPSYDLFGREEVETRLIDTTSHLYFYFDKSWWDDLSSDKKDEVEDSLESLGKEFDDNIYPTLTSEYGSEWKPGIDNDRKITVLIHPMRGAATGYFNNGNEYSVYQNSNSNEREMVYLDARHINDDMVASYLAHELTHLITFNQKERLNNIQEEIWLNEARAEYAPTLCGYNDEYEGSYLKARVSNFLKNPSDSLTEWQGKVADYGALNLFIHYLADHYGKEILMDSLKSSKIGIESINEALKNNGFDEEFSQIFTDWTIAVFINDCSLDEKYCYLNENLKDLRVVPQSNYLPMSSESILSVFYQTKDWTGSWHKIFGGKGNLEFEFDGEDDIDFETPYIICRKNDNCFVDFLELDNKQKGQIKISNFGEEYSYFTIIPLTQKKIAGFNGSEPTSSYSWQAKSSNSDSDSNNGDGNNNENEENDIPIEDQPGETKEEKLNRLLSLLQLIKDRIAEILAEDSSDEYSCQSFNNNLYYGMRNNNEVMCLQEFLKDQGSDIYPEGLVTGNFLSLTKAAIIRFQEKYKEQILTPLGLKKGTGYFGFKTREIINQLID